MLLKVFLAKDPKVFDVDFLVMILELVLQVEFAVKPIENSPDVDFSEMIPKMVLKKHPP
jgi:hypothetical protein